MLILYIFNICIYAERIPKHLIKIITSVQNNNFCAQYVIVPLYNSKGRWNRDGNEYCLFIGLIFNSYKLIIYSNKGYCLSTTKDYLKFFGCSY